MLESLFMLLFTLGKQGNMINMAKIKYGRHKKHTITLDQWLLLTVTLLWIIVMEYVDFKSIIKHGVEK